MMKYIVFDMDGVIVDSEYTYLESKAKILHEEGYDKPISYQYQFMGTTYEFMWTTMKEELGLDKSVDYYIEQMNNKREEMIQRDGVKPIKGVVKYIEKLKSEGATLAVASSSPKKEIEHNLTELGIIDFFEVLVSGEEVENSKPAPDIFLRAAELLQVTPEKCVAYEDTKNGSLSAKTAGMYVIGFENPDYPAQDLSAADEIINSFV
ncbi:haloacid dehalogenase [Suicoccus acidiformans]|uniref:Haloacid dehalogenase n=1 Tax=Suicoccus acidiformans TaxID=2036206 RepID=A0A347WIR0_9LACT|nr:HAD family hydrolase [Suicoccus acidiformans]AXY24967.1 haloacid dehalogenase [Suicoccus acidiformans]